MFSLCKVKGDQESLPFLVPSLGRHEALRCRKDKGKIGGRKGKKGKCSKKKVRGGGRGGEREKGRRGVNSAEAAAAIAKV